MTWTTDEETSYADYIEQQQRLINSGTVWKLEGSAGREAMRLIDAGECMLGEVGHRDYWGGYIPGRTEVVEGTRGSRTYCEQHCSAEAAEAHAVMRGEA